jgi:type II secretory pathway pseudopilin PulG
MMEIRSKSRVGLTLIELLIVSAVLLILASLSLTAMKGLLKGQKVGQAATTLKQYLQNAQVRALASGRPVAVFLDRVSMVGDSSGNMTAQNFTVTRLQFGEVFPPYTGDTATATGTLESVDFSSATPVPTARMIESPVGSGNYIADSYADQIRIPLDQVSAGFGLGDSTSPLGFVRPGDFIEIDGSTGRFVIESYTPFPNATNPTHVQVQFFNPPSTYTAVRQAKAANARHPIYEAADHAAVPVQPLNVGNTNVGFKIFRQPTRSLVGSVVLPRGTCIDLSLSGVGIADSAVDGGTFSRRGVVPNSTETSVLRSDFSRFGLVFNSEGRLAYILDEDSWRDDSPNNAAISTNQAQPARIAMDADSMVYLMVGRTDQVLPGFLGSNEKLSALQHPDVDSYTLGQEALPKSNLLDAENIWISCNPITGEVRSSRVAELAPADVNTMAAAVQAAPTTTFINGLVRQSRALAASGLSN